MKGLGQNEVASEDQLVVAIDFGTTFSGIAYAFKNRDKPDVVSIMDWPGLQGRKQPKVPTAICYDDRDTSKFTWGGERHHGSVFQHVKLLLDPDQPMPIYLPETTAKADTKRLGKPAVDVAADFIKTMYDHAMSKIGSTVPRGYMDICQKHFVLSVPAVWSDKAKDKTLKAAEKAGVFPVTLIKEPEAAALYVLHTLKDFALHVGDAFVVCDAGGGTVDLISYEITQLQPRLELKELVPGKGGMVGSLGLNKRFEEAVRGLVGEYQFNYLRETKGFKLALEYFDQTVKTAFRDDDDEFYVNFPMGNLEDDKDMNISSNCWTMEGNDVRAIFNPLITDIERMVAEQVQLLTIKRMSEGHPKAEIVKAIFLVGGFGSSEYLKSRLEAEHPEIQVIQPHDAWAAIVKGAVLSKLPQQALIISNQATRHYGVKAELKYDPIEDIGQLRRADRSTGEERVSKMTWYIKRGDDILHNQTIRFPFYRRLSDGYSDSQLVFHDELIQSESRIPPAYPSGFVTKTNCLLKADLRDVDRSKFRKVIGVDNHTYYDVNYDLAITMKSAFMKFSLEMDGKEMGTIDTRYE
ncbi:Hsp70 family protein-like protein [Rhexocercosporidium sp. MPI-PUGE-AT-0058]|nr:Hsp70 family protein-like protein [Rhexocercosporidium sp. MPI-PUGE-AT-0058]